MFENSKLFCYLNDQQNPPNFTKFEFLVEHVLDCFTAINGIEFNLLTETYSNNLDFSCKTLNTSYKKELKSNDGVIFLNYHIFNPRDGAFWQITMPHLNTQSIIELNDLPSLKIKTASEDSKAALINDFTNFWDELLA